MKNIDIIYKTSRDYKKLYNLLKAGKVIIGFIALDIEGKLNCEYSKLIQMHYHEKFKTFDIGFTFWEDDLEKLVLINYVKSIIRNSLTQMFYNITIPCHGNNYLLRS